SSRPLLLISVRHAAAAHVPSCSAFPECCCIPPAAIMQNEEGKTVDLYVPRKCSATNRIITAKDHASVQINIGHLDENGLYDGRFTTFALSGFVRAQGDADSSLDRLWQKKRAEIKQ
ncbi:unnamed protein product, partial [Urochloa humidicola]